MKKNFSVNIGGRIFNIDEDAYERLNQYLAGLRSYFSSEDGKDEIISDIEFRVSELFDQRKSQGSTIITIEIVKEVIASIGEPDQFSDREESESLKGPSEKSHGKLFRDPGNRLIGGVAAGIAAFFGLNPVWIRILFVILTFIYAIGIILYIILWLILPEALTFSERLEMQRRSINLDNLRNEVNAAGTGIRRTGNSVLGAIGNILRFLTEVLTHVFKLLLKILRMASGLFLIGLVLLMFLGFILSYVVRNPFSTGMYHLDSITFSNVLIWLVPGPSIRWLGYMVLALLVVGLTGILIYLGLRLLLKWPPLRWQVLGIFGLAILAGLLIAGAAVYQYSSSTEETTSSSKIRSYALQKNFLHISLASENTNEYWHPLSGNDVYLSSQQVLGNIDLSIRPAPGDSLIVTTIREASDFHQGLAENHLNNIEYSYKMEDTLATLNPYFMFPKSDGMHYQTLELILGIPVNTKVRFNENIRWKLNYHEYLDEPDSLGEYIMTQAGLQALHPPKPEEEER